MSHCKQHADETQFVLLPKLQTLTSVLITMENVIITASTPQEAIRVTAKQDTSCMASRSVCVSLKENLTEGGKHLFVTKVQLNKSLNFS